MDRERAGDRAQNARPPARPRSEVGSKESANNCYPCPENVLLPMSWAIQSGAPRVRRHSPKARVFRPAERVWQIDALVASRSPSGAEGLREHGSCGSRRCCPREFGRWTAYYCRAAVVSAGLRAARAMVAVSTVRPPREIACTDITSLSISTSMNAWSWSKPTSVSADFFKSPRRS